MSNDGTALRDRWTFRANSGMRIGDFFGLLRESRGSLPRHFRSRAVFLTIQSLLNELLHREEERQLSQLINRQRPAAPLFVLGHWRSGTSMLHQLLSMDERFAFPTLLQAQNPHTFFLVEGLLEGPRARLARKLYMRWVGLIWGSKGPEQWARPLDKLVVGHSLPEEDEQAMRMLRLSPEVDLAFRSLLPRYAKYSNLRQLSPLELARWKSAWLRYLKKLTLRYRGRPLVLKSPHHTARVRYLLEMFPDAKFIHIHRHPFDLLPSCEMMNKIQLSYPFGSMNYEMPEGEFVTHYQLLYAPYLEDRHRIPSGQLHELKYRDLCARPMEEMERAYQALSLPNFEACRKEVRRWIEATRDHQTNSYLPLSAREKAFVHETLKEYFDDFGYSP